MMKMRFVLAISAAGFVSACTSDAPRPQPIAAMPALMDESVPQISRDACLREVGRTTNNPDLTILEMVYSEANSQVTIGVGPNRARWQCTVSNSGIVAGVMSLTNEGTL
ncbi:MAG: hypothetical protein MUC58_12610 [Rhizobiaceae bacterium]|jgi:hypothetical protein|nr:hypothetical protein [Rhizobiaceae bacterium]